MIREHDNVVLTEDLSTAPLKAGDVGTVVHVHKDREAFEVEFATLLATVMSHQLRPISAGDISHVRDI